MYDISILSTIPLSVSSIVTNNTAEPRLRPLFSVGVHDIPFLEEQAKRRQSTGMGNCSDDQVYGSWVASTTDGVLYVKSSLYDVVVTLPPPHTKNEATKAWPKMECPAGNVMKATQRDLRRYRKLRKGLQQYTSTGHNMRCSSDGPDLTAEQYQASSAEEEAVCEKASWAELAYSGFLWWASAGEKRQDHTSEDAVVPAQGHPSSEDLSQNYFPDGSEDRPLLDTPTQDEDENQEAVTDDVPQQAIDPETPDVREPGNQWNPGTVEMDIIAYFHRLTARIINGMAEVIESSIDYPDGDGNPEEDRYNLGERQELLDGSGYGSSPSAGRKVDVWFSKEEMANMGLDQWSEEDERFLSEMGRTWWKKEVAVEKGGLCGCCGVL